MSTEPLAAPQGRVVRQEASCLDSMTPSSALATAQWWGSPLHRGRSRRTGGQDKKRPQGSTGLSEATAELISFASPFRTSTRASYLTL